MKGLRSADFYLLAIQSCNTHVCNTQHPADDALNFVFCCSRTGVCSPRGRYPGPQPPVPSPARSSRAPHGHQGSPRVCRGSPRRWVSGNFGRWCYSLQRMFVVVYLGSGRIVVPASGTRSGMLLSGILSGTLLYEFAEVDGGAERLSAAISHKIADPAVVALCSLPNVSAE